MKDQFGHDVTGHDSLFGKMRDELEVQLYPERREGQDIHNDCMDYLIGRDPGVKRLLKRKEHYE
jgi:hypothetical protein